MESLAVRPARPSDAADLARNWIDGARHYVELDADAYQVPSIDGLVAWFDRYGHLFPEADTALRARLDSLFRAATEHRRNTVA